MMNAKYALRWAVRIVVSAVVILAVVIVTGIVTLQLSPSSAAYGADYLRKIVGDRPVAWMEMGLFQMEDALKQAEFKLGWIAPADPFAAQSLTIPGGSLSMVVGQDAAQTHTDPSNGRSGGVNLLNPVLNGQATVASSNSSAQTGSSNGGISKGWALPTLDALSGQLINWQPYLQDPAGNVVAYRTFLNPDTARPYAYAAVVAFDLAKTRLHYILGSEEPYAPGVKITSNGRIPAADLQPGVILAAFNGGFKYEHGQYGSMSAGLVSAPPQNGLGTLAIYTDGRVKLGEWGKDILTADGLAAYRQNGPLVIQNGEINPRVEDPSVWGRTITATTATWRSGIATSKDGNTLYYLAGPYLSVNDLAKAMQAVGAQDGIQLDINHFWVHFTALRSPKGKLVAEPLVAQGMSSDINRFLTAYPRDYFYITSLP